MCFKSRFYNTISVSRSVIGSFLSSIRGQTDRNCVRPCDVKLSIFQPMKFLEFESEKSYWQFSFSFIFTPQFPLHQGPARFTILVCYCKKQTDVNLLNICRHTSFASIQSIAFCLTFRRVSMGLSVSRKSAKKIAVSRRNGVIFTVNRKRNNYR